MDRCLTSSDSRVYFEQARVRHAPARAELCGVICDANGVSNFVVQEQRDEQIYHQQAQIRSHPEILGNGNEGIEVTGGMRR